MKQAELYIYIRIEISTIKTTVQGMPLNLSMQYLKENCNVQYIF